MQITTKFIKNYLLPIGIIILLIAVIFLLFMFGESLQGTWKFYAAISAMALVVVILVVVIRQVIADETSRQQVNEKIGAADEKYTSLLETSADGTLMILEQEIVYANFVFLAMSGYTFNELVKMKFEKLILGKENKSLTLDSLYDDLAESGRTLTFEAAIASKRGETRDVILTLSKIELQGEKGFIVISRDMSGRERIKQESLHLKNELHSSILMMNLPISSFTREYISCGMDTSIHKAALLMSRKKQDALIVTREAEPVGILTDSDLRTRVVAKQQDLNKPVYGIMSSPLKRISDQSLLYEGILQVNESGISHLVVEDRNGKISGIFSKLDLLEVQHNSFTYLIREVNAAETVESLKNIHNKIPVLVNILLESGARILNITYMISTVADAITQRLIEFAIDEMGEPPAKFAFMALGSEGRREQTLVTDQDNAIIFEDVPNEKYSEVNRYFLYFGKKINLWLDRIGYQYCQGEVMAGNPQWCQPLSKWEKYFSNWAGQRSDEAILGVAVFFDFRVVYGEKQFGKDLRQHINRAVSGKDNFFSCLAREVAGYEIPLNIFDASDNAGALPESLNMKNAMSPLTGFIRVYALRNRVVESNSLQRLEKLRRLNIISETDYQELENMYCSLMEIRFRSQVDAILANRAPDNIVGQEELTALEQTIVRKAFSEIKRFQNRIVQEYGT